MDHCDYVQFFRKNDTAFGDDSKIILVFCAHMRNGEPNDELLILVPFLSILSLALPISLAANVGMPIGLRFYVLLPGCAHKNSDKTF